MGDDIRGANFTMIEGATEGVIYSLQQDTIYKLRVQGVSRGGEGKKSPTVYFTVTKGRHFTNNFHHLIFISPCQFFLYNFEKNDLPPYTSETTHMVLLDVYSLLMLYFRWGNQH